MQIEEFQEKINKAAVITEKLKERLGSSDANEIFQELEEEIAFMRDGDVGDNPVMLSFVMTNRDRLLTLVDLIRIDQPSASMMCDGIISELHRLCREVVSR